MAGSFNFASFNSRQTSDKIVVRRVFLERANEALKVLCILLRDSSDDFADTLVVRRVFFERAKEAQSSLHFIKGLVRRLR
jgi:hypothetical protein